MRECEEIGREVLRMVWNLLVVGGVVWVTTRSTEEHPFIGLAILAGAVAAVLVSLMLWAVVAPIIRYRQSGAASLPPRIATKPRATLAQIYALDDELMRMKCE